MSPVFATKTNIIGGPLIQARNARYLRPPTYAFL